MLGADDDPRFSGVMLGQPVGEFGHERMFAYSARSSWVPGGRRGRLSRRVPRECRRAGKSLHLPAGTVGDRAGAHSVAPFPRGHWGSRGAARRRAMGSSLPETRQPQGGWSLVSRSRREGVGDRERSTAPDGHDDRSPHRVARPPGTDLGGTGRVPKAAFSYYPGVCCGISAP
jgi:hypothetical protein